MSKKQSSSTQVLVSNKNEENGILYFTLHNTNVSLANSLRRIILSEIPIVVFKTFPYDETKVTIHKNTTRFNNEIIKQRMSCIPIHITDLSIPLEDYLIELNVSNKTKSLKYVTTEDFQVKNVKQNKYLSKSEVSTIFPPNSYTKQYIDILRLNPNIEEDTNIEEISLSATLMISNAKDNGAFNVVSTCFYENTLDNQKMEVQLEKFLAENVTDEDDEDSIESKRKNWFTLDAKRHFVQDSFDFTIKSIGIFPNIEILKTACNIMQEKLSLVIEQSDKQELKIEKNLTTMKNSYDITLENEDYTLGKVIEFVLNDEYYNKNSVLSYCGFKKFHPHDSFSIIRLSFNDKVDISTISQYVRKSCEIAIETYELIKIQIS